MAVTAIWDIKGRVDKVINYVSNPEKTTEKGLDFAASLHVIDDVLEYVGEVEPCSHRGSDRLLCW